MLKSFVAFIDNLYVHVDIDFILRHGSAKYFEVGLNVVVVQKLDFLAELRVKVDHFAAPDQILACYNAVIVLVNHPENENFSLSRILVPKCEVESFQKCFEVNSRELYVITE